MRERTWILLRNRICVYGDVNIVFDIWVSVSNTTHNENVLSSSSSFRVFLITAHASRIHMKKSRKWRFKERIKDRNKVECLRFISLWTCMCVIILFPCVWSDMSVILSNNTNNNTYVKQDKNNRNRYRNSFTQHSQKKQHHRKFRWVRLNK